MMAGGPGDGPFQTKKVRTAGKMQNRHGIREGFGAGFTPGVVKQKILKRGHAAFPVELMISPSAFRV